MILNISKYIGKLLQIFPKYKLIKLLNMEAKFFIPINNHYVSQDLINLAKGKREPKLFDWLNSFENNSVYFDIGTSYGQEVTLVSSMLKKTLKFLDLTAVCSKVIYVHLIKNLIMIIFNLFLLL